MATTISIHAEGCAVAVQVSSGTESRSADGNRERNEFVSVQTAEFVPPYSGAVITLQDDEDFGLQVLAEGIQSMDDLRRSTVGARMATADLDVGAQEVDRSWDDSFQEQSTQASDVREAREEDAELAEQSPVQDGGYETRPTQPVGLPDYGEEAI